MGEDTWSAFTEVTEARTASGETAAILARAVLAGTDGLSCRGSAVMASPRCRGGDGTGVAISHAVSESGAGVSVVAAGAGGGADDRSTAETTLGVLAVELSELCPGMRHNRLRANIEMGETSLLSCRAEGAGAGAGTPTVVVVLSLLAVENSSVEATWVMEKAAEGGAEVGVADSGGDATCGSTTEAGLLRLGRCVPGVAPAAPMASGGCGTIRTALVV